MRLYGNDPAFDHRPFLDEAKVQGLHVLAGISDYPYLQMPGNCLQTQHNCYLQVKNAYKQNLMLGFLDMPTRTYHPALRAVILMNEPDLKFLPAEVPELFCKALASALDGVLDAEKEMGVVGPRPNFTATFSFGVCWNCSGAGANPGLGQMRDLRRAMWKPESVGYHASNDLWKAYQERFENSVNTANPARGPGGFKRFFLDDYNRLFPSTPVFVGEYHSPATADLRGDLEAVLELAEDPATMLTGISFFEFQVRYDKGGAEMSFGIFGLGDKALSQVTLGAPAAATGQGTFPVWCLEPVALPEPPPACRKVARGVEFRVHGNQSIDVRNVPSPGQCCARCSESPGCGSWTWRRGRRCRLHHGLPKGRLHRAGAVSGLPPDRSRPRPDPLSAPSALAAAFRGPGLSPEVLCPRPVGSAATRIVAARK